MEDHQPITQINPIQHELFIQFLVIKISVLSFLFFQVSSILFKVFNFIHSSLLFEFHHCHHLVIVPKKQETHSCLIKKLD